MRRQAAYPLTALLFGLLIGGRQALAENLLPEVLGAGDCPASCFMGIVPGQTSRAELEELLVSRHIAFQSDTLDFSGKLRLYSFYPDVKSALVDNQKTVAVMVGGDTVEEIAVRLHDVTIQMVVGSYGAPSAIVNAGSNKMVYIDAGLAFHVADDDRQMVDFVYLRSAGIDGSIASYLVGDPCQGMGGVCAIATATPTPIETSTPAPFRHPIEP